MTAASPSWKPSGDQLRDDNRGQHGDLAIGQIEDSRQPVHQRQADAQQSEPESEDDPVEDDRLYTIPRYARRTSGF